MPNASWRRRGVATARRGGSPTLGTERSGSGKGGAKRRAAQAKRGSLGKLLAGARGGPPLGAFRGRRLRGWNPPLRGVVEAAGTIAAGAREGFFPLSGYVAFEACVQNLHAPRKSALAPRGLRG